MILYNVTLNVDPLINEEWLIWMKEIHIPEVMATNKFISYSFYKIQNHNLEDNSLNYSVQYHANTLEDFKDYETNYAPALKRKTIEKYGEKILAFRTILEKIN